MKRDPVDVEMEKAVLRVTTLACDVRRYTGIRGNEKYHEFVARLALEFARDSRDGARALRKGE